MLFPQMISLLIGSFFFLQTALATEEDNSASPQISTPSFESPITELEYFASSSTKDSPSQEYSLSNVLRNACPTFREDQLGYRCYHEAILNIEAISETTDMILRMCEDPDLAFRRRCLREAVEEFNILVPRLDLAEAIVNACLKDNVSPIPYRAISRCYLRASLHSGSSLILVVREACKEGSNPQQTSSCFTRALSNFPSDPNSLSSSLDQADFLKNLFR